MEAAAEAQRQRVAKRAGLAAPVEQAATSLRPPVQLSTQGLAEQSGKRRPERGAETGLLREGGPNLRFRGQGSGPERRAEPGGGGDDPLGDRLQLLVGEALLRGCRVTSTASDFWPSGTPWPVKTSNRPAPVIAALSAPLTARTSWSAGRSAGTRKAKSRVTACKAGGA